MRNNGPHVVITCAVCGMSIPVTTTIQAKRMPGMEAPTPVILVPLVIHCGDGGHIAAHPAMTTEEMGTT